MVQKIASRNARFAVIPEVTPGVTPATPAWQVFRSTGEGIEVMRALTFTSELNGRRGKSAYGINKKSAGASIPFKLTYGTLDAVLESALRNTWSTNILTDSTLQKSFSLETTFEGGASDIYKRAWGAEVDTLTLQLRAGEDTTGTVSFMALDGDYAQAIVTGATYVAPNTNPILNFGDFSNLTMAGLTVGCVSSLDISIKNNLAEVMCLGSLAPTDLDGSGTLEITGSMAIALTSDEYDILRFGTDATPTSLSFEVGRTAGSKYRIELPNIVLRDTNPKAEDADGGTVLITPTFEAMQASTLSNAVIRVTRAI